MVMKHGCEGGRVIARHQPEVRLLHTNKNCIVEDKGDGVDVGYRMCARIRLKRLDSVVHRVFPNKPGVCCLSTPPKSVRVFLCDGSPTTVYCGPKNEAPII